MMAVVCIGGEVTQRMGWGLPRVDSSKDGMDFQIDWDVRHLFLFRFVLLIAREVRWFCLFSVQID